MRPYWTILRDAFHEALASRVLWVVLAIITLVLLALAPLGYRLDLVTEFAVNDFRDARQFIQQLHQEGTSQEPSPGRRIWAEIPESARDELLEFAVDEEGRGGDYFRGARKLVGQLNQVIANPDLYSEANWQGVHFRRELRELVERPASSLSATEVARRNRLLIEAAYRSELEPRPRESILITYAGLDMSPPLPLTKSQMDQLIEQFALTLLMNLLLGWGVLLAGLLVTAPIIPQMFQPGSLHLLLSKPISRSLLFITRVLGGCAFMLICVSYLIVGLWLIAGTRFGLWNAGMLQCIPVFLFLFGIYYVVSALIGAIWKNAVVAVVLTLSFLFFCLFLSTSKGTIESLVIQPQRIVNLVVAGETLIAVDERGVTKQWNPGAQDWDEVFFTRGPRGGGARLIGPIYDPQEERLLAARLQSSPMGNFLAMGSNLQVGLRDKGWHRTDGARLPRGVFQLLQEPDGDVLAASDQGVFRLVESPTDEAEGSGLFDFLRLPKLGGPSFEPVSPGDWSISRPAAAAINASTGQLAVYQAGTITLLTPTEKNQYEKAVEVELPVDTTASAGLAYGGSTVVVVLADGRVLILNGNTLQTRATLTPVESSPPRFAEASPDGRWVSIVYQDGQMWLLDTEADQIERPRIDGQGDISAAVFTPGGELFVAAHGTRVAIYDPATFERHEILRPRMSRIEWIYHYVLMPVYTIFPKPSELNETIQYLLTKQTTSDLAGLAGNDLQAKHQELHPWSPIWSSAAFMAFVLLIACVYLERQEF